MATAIPRRRSNQSDVSASSGAKVADASEQADQDPVGEVEDPDALAPTRR